jgi:ribosomal protein L37E
VSLADIYAYAGCDAQRKGKGLTLAAVPLDRRVGRQFSAEINMETCIYCGEPRREKIGCCGENHWDETPEGEIMFNDQLDKNSKNHLRHHPLVVEWIKDYQKQNHHIKYDDCSRCGWPHSSVFLCGMGSNFGQVKIGRCMCYIDTSNVKWTVDFVQSLGKGCFHWRDNIYIKRLGDDVVISHIEYYNDSPSLKDWKIPVNEFASIVCAASVGGETQVSYEIALNFLTPNVELSGREEKL